MRGRAGGRAAAPNCAEPSRPGLQRLAGRAGWSIADQVLSSLSNMALSVLIARQVDRAAYGAFALAFAMYAFVVLVTRLLVSQPLAIRFSDVSREELRTAASDAAGAALIVGAFSGAVMAATATALGGVTAWTLVTTGILLPGLLVQDTWRMIFFACGRPAAAAANDGFWGLTQLIGVVALSRLGVTSPIAYLLVWGLAGTAGACLGTVQAHATPHPRRAWRWLRGHWDLTRYFVMELLAINGAGQMMMMLVGGLGGLAAVGALRGAQVLTSPITILMVGGMVCAVPEIARRPQLVGRRLLRVGAAISAVAVAPAIVWGILLVELPPALGRELLGATWAGTSAVLWPSVIGMVAAISSIGATCCIHGRGRPRILFGLSLSTAPGFLLGGVVGVLVAGAKGAAVGLALAQVYSAVVAWTRVSVLTRPMPTAPERQPPRMQEAAAFD